MSHLGVRNEKKERNEQKEWVVLCNVAADSNPEVLWEEEPVLREPSLQRRNG